MFFFYHKLDDGNIPTIFCSDFYCILNILNSLSCSFSQRGQTNFLLPLSMYFFLFPLSPRHFSWLFTYIWTLFFFFLIFWIDLYVHFSKRNEKKINFPLPFYMPSLSLCPSNFSLFYMSLDFLFLIIWIDFYILHYKSKKELISSLFPFLSLFLFSSSQKQFLWTLLFLLFSSLLI